MIIKFEQLDRELKQTFPSLSDWAPVATEWEEISHEEVDALIASYPSKRWTPDYPCGLIARGFSAYVHYHFADGSGRIKAFGVAHGDMIGDTPEHTVNIYRYQGILWLLDMQTKERRPADDRDDIYFVEM